jgi:hypothetical protein
MAKLPEFDMASVDKLKDYAYALWYVYLSLHPQISPSEMEALMKEAAALRAKLLLWAEPLAASGYFAPEAVARIRECTGLKDMTSDLVSLTILYRSKWSVVKSVSGAVTEADLDRAALIGPATFGFVSKKEQTTERPNAAGSLLLRRALTKLDRAYFQCRRAILYFVQSQEALDEVAPNLRRNPGVARRPAPESKAPAGTAQPAVPPLDTDEVVPLVTGGTVPAAGFGSGGSPFVAAPAKKG